MLKEIVLTGGPSGGKSFAINFIAAELEKRGYKVFKVPEVATDYMEMGLDIAGGKFSQREVQMAVNHEYRDRRNLCKLWSQKYDKSVIIYDRYVMDGAAYYDGNYTTLLRDGNFDWMEACQFPDVVIHMQSPAVDKPEAYDYTNPHRYSSVKSAAKEDRATMQAWVSHSHFRVVDNSTSFTEKVQRAAAHAIHAIEGDEIERKFRVKMVKPWTSNIPQATKVIEQIYIALTRYSRCTYMGQCTYQTAMKSGEGLVRKEFEEWMTPQAWSNVVRNAKQPEVKARFLTKTRDNFVWNGRFYELDSIGTGLILEIELTDPDEKYEIPPHFEVIEEVTEDPAWKSKNLAKTSSDGT